MPTHKQNSPVSENSHDLPENAGIDISVIHAIVRDE
jgi:hypothetical protein